MSVACVSTVKNSRFHTMDNPKRRSRRQQGQLARSFTGRARSAAFDIDAPSSLDELTHRGSNKTSGQRKPEIKLWKIS
jgi:hypothetical protein